MFASFRSYNLQFKNPILTSRGGMAYKNGYYIEIKENGTTGLGECSYIEGLSIDELSNYETKLTEVCRDIQILFGQWAHFGHLPDELLMRYPSIAFGLETAFRDLVLGGKKEIISDSAFYTGLKSIPVNGLIWMGSDSFMQEQIELKLADGYRCIKIKVGAIDFKEECRLIASIRERYSPDEIEIRLDANGGFAPENVRDRLLTLSQFSVHSIEQPIKPQQYLLMRELSEESIIPIALDEELIGIWQDDIRHKLLDTIRPQYIILKPSLLGGLSACDRWISAAGKYGINWWATSALESNIGLNAIAQWASAKATDMVQGLGTGSLYLNNVKSPLYIEKGCLHYDPKGEWADVA